MEQQDLELERRVWQRISGGGTDCDPEGGTSLREMEQRCREAAGVFRQLAQSCTGSMRDCLQELSRQDYANAMTLMGMRVLSGEEPEKAPGCPWSKTGTCRALALMYRQSCKARENYAFYANKSEYAPVFAVMERMEAKKMGKLLCLIGMCKVG